MSKSGKKRGYSSGRSDAKNGKTIFSDAGYNVHGIADEDFGDGYRDGYDSDDSSNSNSSDDSFSVFNPFSWFS